MGGECVVSGAVAMEEMLYYILLKRSGVFLKILECSKMFSNVL